jgi:hypothetical protein
MRAARDRGLGGRAQAWLTGLALASACGDPVHEARIAALGAEDPNVVPGALHRPGQPCLACHDGTQLGAERYSFAGTLYAQRGAPDVAPDVSVELVDSRGVQARARSNCAGNFFVTPGEFEPLFPVWVSLRMAGYVIDMQSPIERDGSCASCHAATASQSQTDAVYLYTLSDGEFERGACP